MAGLYGRLVAAGAEDDDDDDCIDDLIVNILLALSIKLIKANQSSLLFLTV